MKALVFKEINAPLAVEERPTPEPRSGEALVAIRAAALNRRDYFITKGLYPGLRPGTIVGSDGAGVAEGREVIVNPSLQWGDDPAVQGPDYHIIGMPTDGAFAGYVVVPEENLFDKPAHLTFEQASALPLAGLTAYRTLFTRCALRQGERVLVTGVGGGVALFALQFAVAAGAEVFVTSGSDDKIGRAVALGARGGVNYRSESWDKLLKKEAGGFDVIIDGAGGPGLALLLKLCKPAARVGSYGGTLGKVPDFSPQLLFWKQLNLLGSTMGSPADFAGMIELVNRHGIVPVVDSVFPLERGNEAIARMGAGEQFGKLVLSL